MEIFSGNIEEKIVGFQFKSVSAKPTRLSYKFHKIKQYGRSGIYRSVRSQVFYKISVLKNFTIFTERHLCWSLFLIKLQAWKPTTLSKRLQHRCFPVNIAKLLRTAFFIEQLRWLLLDFLQNLLKTTLKIIISQESFSQKFLRNDFLVFVEAFLKITPYRFFAVFVFL